MRSDYSFATVKLSLIPMILICGIHICLLSSYLVYIGFSWGQAVPSAFGVFIVLALLMISPIGEFILRLFCGARSIQRTDWDRKAKRALDAVYEAAADKGLTLPQNVKLYFVYSPLQTSFSFGRKTICLSAGLLDANEQTIEAYLAHEFGHIKYLDSTMVLLANAGNIPWLLIGSVLRLLSRGLRFFSMFNRFRLMGLLLFLFSAFLYIPRAVVWLFLLLTRLILSIGNRRKEYEADAFCVRLGYGRELRSALLTADVDAQTNPRELWQSLIASHPGAYDRVGRIDHMMDCTTQNSARRTFFEIVSE